MSGETYEQVHWERANGRWEAQLGIARLIVIPEGGRYVPVVEMHGAIFSEHGYTFRVWAMQRAEQIARDGGRGVAFP